MSRRPLIGPICTEASSVTQWPQIIFLVVVLSCGFLSLMQGDTGWPDVIPSGVSPSDQWETHLRLKLALRYKVRMRHLAAGLLVH